MKVQDQYSYVNFTKPTLSLACPEILEAIDYLVKVWIINFFFFKINFGEYRPMFYLAMPRTGFHTIALKRLSFFCGFHSDSARKLFTEEKERIKREHRKECRSAFGSIFGEGSCMEGDLVVINFFALVIGTSS